MNHARLPVSSRVGFPVLSVFISSSSMSFPSRRTYVATEMVGIDSKSKEILTNEVYKWNALDDSYSYSGRSYLIERICERTGITVKNAIVEIDRKKRLLQWMSEIKIRSYQQVSEIIRKYNNNKEIFVGEELSIIV